MYIDADDAFLPEALLQLKEELEKNRGIDILRFNHVIVEPMRLKLKNVGLFLIASRNNDSGRDFIKRNSIPYAPWSYVFYLPFLKKYNLYFAENVMFEDMGRISKRFF